MGGDSVTESHPVDFVIVENQKTTQLVEWACFHDLLRGPLRGRMAGNTGSKGGLAEHQEPSLGNEHCLPRTFGRSTIRLTQCFVDSRVLADRMQKPSKSKMIEVRWLMFSTRPGSNSSEALLPLPRRGLGFLRGEPLLHHHNISRAAWSLPEISRLGADLRVAENSNRNAFEGQALDETYL